YPGRVDLGIGRAPGGSAESSMALSGNFLENVRNMPDDLDELIQFLYDGFPEDNMFSKIAPTPVPDVPPQVWLLGTSEKSGKLATDKGLSYTFGHFMSNANGPEIVQKYLATMKKREFQAVQKPIIAVSVICAETEEEAEELALSNKLWSVLAGKGKGKQGIHSVKEANETPLTKETKEKQNMIIENTKPVRDQCWILQSENQTDEFIIVTITHDYEARKTTYEVNANEMLKEV